MKVAILGSGVVGVTSAWYLAQAGHEVTVIDRQDGPEHWTQGTRERERQRRRRQDGSSDKQHIPGVERCP